MRISIRLYRTHDIELVSLHKNPNVNLPKIIKTALYSYVHDIPYFIPAPAPDNNKEYKKVYQIFLNFDEIKDKDIIDWFKTIKPNYRTTAIKTITKGCIAGAVAYACFIDETTAISKEESLIKKNQDSISLQSVPNYITKEKKNKPKTKHNTKTTVENKSNKKKYIDKNKKSNIIDAKKEIINNEIEDKYNNKQNINTSNNLNINNNEQLYENNKKQMNNFDNNYEFDFNNFGDFSNEDQSTNNSVLNNNFDLFADLNNMLNNFNGGTK